MGSWHNLVIYTWVCSFLDWPHEGGIDLNKTLTSGVCLKLGGIKISHDHLQTTQHEANLTFVEEFRINPFIRFSQYLVLLPVPIVLKQRPVCSFINLFHVYLFSDHVLVMCEGGRPRHFTRTFHLSNPISWEFLIDLFNKETMQLFKEPDQFPLCLFPLTWYIFQISYCRVSPSYHKDESL